LLVADDAPLEEGVVAEGAAAAEDPLLGVVELVDPFKQVESPGLNEIGESIKDRQYTPPD